MAVTPQSFRQTFRMFKNPDVAPDDAIVYYTTLAMNALAGSTMGTRFDAISLDRAVSLYVAHSLTLDARDIDAIGGGQNQTPTGAVPGEIKGPATTKTVDKVSVSFDTKAVSWEDEAYWNQTRFGVELVNMIRMFGAGGIQLGTPGAGDVDSVGWGVGWW